MAYICTRENNCKTCPHYRYDDDSMGYACWASYDEKHKPPIQEEKKEENTMKNYHVVIHYKGAVSYDIDASTEDEARKIAEQLMMNESSENILKRIDWDVCDRCDCWEV